MNYSKERFDIQIARIEAILSTAGKQGDAGLALYLNDLRTPLFMLEGLAKMYAAFHNKDDFGKIKEQAKQVEDALGVVDYYYTFKKEFAADSKINPSIKQFFEQKVNEKLVLLNTLLKEENWLNGKRIDKIKQRVENAGWLSEKEEIDEMYKYYEEETDEINNFIKETGCNFDNVEEDVHELRRKLRWLSIYPQALQGAVRLIPGENETAAIKKYLTDEIVNSRFNQLVVSKNLTYHLQLNKNNFLALSWMIAELGKIKDDGLRITALTEAFEEPESINAKQAEDKVMELLGNNYPTEKYLLTKADDIVKTFFAENLLENLLKR